MKYVIFAVTPLAGVWIEICYADCLRKPRQVTPLAGVWIEIQDTIDTTLRNGESLPSRECGLKLD